jgi:hypothetical protein
VLNCRTTGSKTSAEQAELASRFKDVDDDDDDDD